MLKSLRELSLFGRPGRKRTLAKNENRTPQAVIKLGLKDTAQISDAARTASLENPSSIKRTLRTGTHAAVGAAAGLGLAIATALVPSSLSANPAH